MTTVGTTADRRERRPDALALASPTVGNALLLAAVFLTAGLFIGNSAHTYFFGRSYLTAQSHCLADIPQVVTDVAQQIRDTDAAALCRRPSEVRRAEVSLTGPLVIGLLALLVIGLHAPVVTRRRGLRRLASVMPAAAERFAAIADEVGVSPVPTPMIGRTSQRDAFSYGTGRNRRVALPPGIAVRWRDPSVYDHLVRHELAHHLRRDVGLAWLARSTWYALVPLLVLPLLFAGPSGQWRYLGDYLWRVALLAFIALGLTRALLRSREHEADLLSARLSHDLVGTTALVARAVTHGSSTRVRTLLAFHPSPSTRLAVLASPERFVRVSFVDALVVGLLAGLSLPLLRQITQMMLTGKSDSSSHALAMSVTLVGPLVGSVGLGLTRAALACRVAGTRTRVWPAAIGVGLGFLVGQTASLAQTANGTLAGVTNPWSLLTTGWAAMAAVAISGGFAHLVADASSGIGHRSLVRLVVLLGNSLLFIVVLWCAYSLQDILQATDEVNVLRGLVEAWLLFVAPTWPVTAVVILLGVGAGALLVAARRRALVPPWAVDGAAISDPMPTPAGSLGLPVKVGTLAGAVSLAVAWPMRTEVDQTPNTRLNQILLYFLVAAGIAGAAWLVVALQRRRTGPATGLTAALTASVLAAAGALVVSGAFSATRAETALRTSITASFLACLVLAPLVLPGHARQGRHDDSHRPNDQPPP